MLFLIFVFLYPSPFTLYPAFATNSTPSADIKFKLEELKREIASRAAKIKEELSKKLQNKAIPGEVLSIDDKKITIQTRLGQTIVLTNEDTIFQKNNSKIDLKSIKPKDYIVSLGELDDKNNLIAKKIVVIQKKDPSSKIISWAEVRSINGSVIKIKLPDGNEVNLNSTDSKLQNSKGDGDLSQINFGTTIILVGSRKEEKTVDARFIYIAGRKTVIPKTALKNSSASATKSSKPAMR